MNCHCQSSRYILIRTQDKDRQEILSKVRQLQRDIEVCSHPQLVKSGKFPALVGHGTQDGLPFLAMELADAGSLDRMLYQDRDWQARLDILIQLASGMKVLHDNGIQHGDIKPENVLVFGFEDGTYRAKLSDFSHASYDVAAGMDNSHSKYYGTWPFIPVEVWTSTSTVTARQCDIWTYGLLLWRVCQYRNDDSLDILSFVPERHETLTQARMKVLQDHWMKALERFTNTLNGSATIDVSRRDAIVLLFSDCVSIEPQRRPSSGEIIARLECFAQSKTKPEIGARTDDVEKIASDLGNMSLQNHGQYFEISGVQSSEVVSRTDETSAWAATESQFSIFGVSTRSSP
jgi:serine/threonine protein kinase